MYKRITFFLVCFFIGEIGTKAQTKLKSIPTYPYYTIAKWNPINLAFGGFGVSAEQAISRTMSFELAFVTGKAKEFLNKENFRYNGITLYWRNYFRKFTLLGGTPVAGLYAGQLKREFVHYTFQYYFPSGFGFDDPVQFKSNSIRFGFHVGQVFLIKDKFIIEISTGYGAGFYINPKVNNANSEKDGYFDFQPKINLGYIF